jgi:hypothetical protein
MVKNTEQPDFLTIEEIASLLRVQVSAIRARLGRNDPALPPSRRVGGRRLFPTTLYLEWRENLLRTEAPSLANEVTSSASVECRDDGQQRCNNEVRELPSQRLSEVGTAGTRDGTTAEPPPKRKGQMGKD